MTESNFAPHYDVIVVGARCAGASTAMLLARAGMNVLMIDRDQHGTDTLSTHALMRGAVMQLAQWGTLKRIVAAGTPAIRTTSFIYGSERIDLDISASHGVDTFYAPRRTVLDGALATEAAAAGADVHYGVAIEGVVYGAPGRVTGAVLRDRAGRPETVSCDLLIGADGRRSTVARLVGARTEQLSNNAAAAVYRHFGGLENRGNRWYYDTGFAAGVIPTNDDQSCVFLCMPQARFLSEVRGRLDSGLMAAAETAFPELAAELAGAEPVAHALGFAGQHGHMRSSAGNGWALVGDAGYFKDPLTAHGITDALRDAEILARAVISGRPDALRQYQATRDALSRDLFRVTDEIAAMDWDLDALKAMHKRLNKAMKAEQSWMFDNLRQDLRAA